MAMATFLSGNSLSFTKPVLPCLLSKRFPHSSISPFPVGSNSSISPFPFPVGSISSSRKMFTVSVSPDFDSTRYSSSDSTRYSTSVVPPAIPAPSPPIGGRPFKFTLGFLFLLGVFQFIKVSKRYQKFLKDNSQAIQCIKSFEGDLKFVISIFAIWALFVKLLKFDDLVLSCPNMFDVFQTFLESQFAKSIGKKDVKSILNAIHDAAQKKDVEELMAAIAQLEKILTGGKK